MVECKLSLELTKNGVQKSVQAKMGEKDSRKLLITLTEKGKVYDLEGYEARVSYDDKTYTKATIDGNVVEFILPSTLLSGPGERLCELEISVPGESVLYSPMFIVNVEGSLGAEAKNEAVGKDVEYQQVIPDLEETAEMGEEAYIAVYEKGKGTKKYKVKGLGGASKHSELSGRDEADQHPIFAISGLEQKLQDINDADSALWDEALRIDSSVQGLETKSNNQGNRITANENNVSALQSLSHSHENKNVLDRIGVSANNKPTFDKVEIGGGGGGVIDVNAIAPQIVAVLLRDDNVFPISLEPPNVANLNMSALNNNLANIYATGGKFGYAPGEDGTVDILDSWNDTKYSIKVYKEYIYVIKDDPENEETKIYSGYGNLIRQILVNGIDSVTDDKFKSLSQYT